MPPPTSPIFSTAVCLVVVGNVWNYPSVSTLDFGAGIHFRVNLDHSPGLIGLSQHFLMLK